MSTINAPVPHEWTTLEDVIKLTDPTFALDSGATYEVQNVSNGKTVEVYFAEKLDTDGEPGRDEVGGVVPRIDHFTYNVTTDETAYLRSTDGQGTINLSIKAGA